MTPRCPECEERLVCIACEDTDPEISAWAERAHDALREAGVGLLAVLDHDRNSCNPGLDIRCFVCGGLNAVGAALTDYYGDVVTGTQP